MKLCYDRQKGEKEYYYYTSMEILTYNTIKLFVQELYVKVKKERKTLFNSSIYKRLHL